MLPLLPALRSRPGRKRNAMQNYSRPLGIAIPLLWIATGNALGDSPSVRITSPADGTVVAVGTTLVVTVEVTPFEFRGVKLMGDFPDATFTEIATMQPYKIAVQITKYVGVGVHTIVALGVRGEDGRKWVTSDEISIDVEPKDKALKLHSNMMGVLSLYPTGETFQCLIGATFGDGSGNDVTRSTRTTYTSDSPGVVSVTKEGLVTAVSAGSAKITIRNGDAVLVLRVTVPRHPGDPK